MTIDTLTKQLGDLGKTLHDFGKGCDDCMKGYIKVAGAVIVALVSFVAYHYFF